MKIKVVQKQLFIHTGFLSVPYIVELCNCIYLPSQFLVEIQKFYDLHQLLKTTNAYGVKCYAIVGFDSVFKDTLVAWIKFKKMPPQYEDLINNHIQSDNVILSGVYDKNNKTHGENMIYEYMPDVFLLCINEMLW